MIQNWSMYIGFLVKSEETVVCEFKKYLSYPDIQPKRSDQETKQGLHSRMTWWDMTEMGSALDKAMNEWKEKHM